MPSNPHPHLPNAPIVEALLDIRAQVADELSVDTLRSAHESLRGGYPKTKERRRFEGTFKLIKGGSVDATAQEFSVDGYQFISADGLQVVQFRLDGFTFNRLKPYPDWATFRKEAKHLWNVYRRLARPISVSRVALRYINEIVIPVTGHPWHDYLRSPPRLPEEFDRTPKTFLQRFEIDDSDSGTTWLITQALKPSPSPATTTILLDIDVFKQGSFDEESIWGVADLLRKIKNDIFFRTIRQPIALELFQ